MQTDEYPLISIVMAVYKPRVDWLILQLESLDKQTYPNLELLVCDDCPEYPVDEAFFSEHIKAFSYKITRNEKNLGSNSAFEILTAKAQGEYISYCDQDDIWLPEKISELFELINRKKAALVFSDMMIIDGEGRKLADSITQIRKGHVLRRGDDLFGALLTHCFVTGCTMLVRKEIAKGAIPFVDNMVHDHWISLYASSRGRLDYSEKPLIYYRMHDGNQTGVLKNADTKSEYISERIDSFAERMKQIKERFAERDDVKETAEWAFARQNYANHKKGSFSELWKYRGVNPKTTFFELLALRLPDSLFKTAIKAVKRLITRKKRGDTNGKV